MPRREFSKTVYAEIVKRATRDNGNGLRVVYCECCHAQAKVWHVDHINPDAMQVDKSRALTADDGQVLCAGSADTCHGRKTAEDQRNIAKAKRNEADHLRITRPSSSLSVPRAVRKANAEAKAEDRRGGKIGVPPRRMPPGYVSAGDPR